MIFVLLGAPGAGKGTQGSRIVSQFGIPKISTGEMFRDLAASGSDLGLQAKTFWSQGNLVPDDVVVRMVRERISEPDCKNGFLLDGFPRTVNQATVLDEMLLETGSKLDGALNFAVDAERLVKRLSGRRNCSNCGATYHLTAMPPRVDGVCDHCGGQLSRRSDDSPESIKVRLAVYEGKTAPLLEYYRQCGSLLEVDANRDPDLIFTDVKRILAAAGC